MYFENKKIDNFSLWSNSGKIKRCIVNLKIIKGNNNLKHNLDGKINIKYTHLNEKHTASL